MVDYIRQGDVSVFPVSSSFDAPIVADGRAILALGESTGHMHVIEAPKTRYTTDAAVIAALKVELVQKGILMPDADTVAGGIIVEQDADFWHGNHDRSNPDHGTHIVLPGRYAVLREREYSPAEIRQVAD